MSELTDQQRKLWRTNGWLVCEELLDAPTREELPGWIDRIARPAGDAERRLHYYEQTANGKALCRTERFIEDSADLNRLITDSTLSRVAGQLLGEDVRLYKEKVNYKQPGGAGFAPHQDATAYAFVHKHATCLVAIDPMTPENGCLEFSPFGEDRLLPDDGDGCLDRAFANELEWQPVPLPAGAVIFFTSYVPHRSAPNHGNRPRRALYLTYNAASEGDRRAAYYADRDRAIVTAQASAAGVARISTIGHFQGRTVT